MLSSGEAKCWGRNDRGQLGNGDSGIVADRILPVSVSGLSTGVKGITAGWGHTCALLDTGGVKCWGYNGSGQIGDNTSSDKATPTDVSGLNSGVIQIAGGYYHTCALLNTGGVKCWGYNGFGQVGDATQGTNRLTPVDVTGLSSGVARITAGLYHSCALLNTGGVKCWGSGGSIGDGTTTSRPTPVDVSDLTSGVTHIGGGSAHTCAALSTGGLKCWGSNGAGQIGDGTLGGSRLSPVDVVGIGSEIIGIAVGGEHACALLNYGAVKCWGANGNGQVGDGTASSGGKTTPIDVSGLSSGITQVEGGGSHTCAILNTGPVKCWGDNGRGQIGSGTSGNWALTPVDVVGLL